MALKLIFITNNPETAKVAECAGVDRVMVDLEYIGKHLRQGGLDTVKSNHSIADIHEVAQALNHSELIVRVNPIHASTREYPSSEVEINQVIENGAQLLMLPYFKTVAEVETFVKLVDGRAKTILLIETPEAVNMLDVLVRTDGIDEWHIGLNDLGIGYGKKFLFEVLSDGTVDKICNKLRLTGLPYGIGGIASIGKGLLKSEKIIGEHYRLGSTGAILSRSFCNVQTLENLNLVRSIFTQGVKQIREVEAQMLAQGPEFFESNSQEVKDCIYEITHRGNS